MAGNSSLGAAKAAKNDEFYTQYSDIEAEMNAYVEYNPDVFRGKTILLPCDDPEWSNFTKYFAANFTRFGLKKLISTSYAPSSSNEQLTLFESQSPLYDAEKHSTHGKLFTLTRDTDGSGQIDTDDIEFSGYLEGDGDFHSEEVTQLRDEADIIITNPPFSQFTTKINKIGFLEWLLAADKKFIIIGNLNSVADKEVFPLLMNNKIWFGYSIHSGDRKFYVPDNYPLEAAGCGVDENGKRFIRVKGVRWFTNIDHGQRHEKLLLDTMENNLKFNKKLKRKLETNYGSETYPHYDNYDAIEVPFTECIPADYKGTVGVPITFMDKYNPDQFEILGITKTWFGSAIKSYPKQTQVSKNGKESEVTKLNDGAVVEVKNPPDGKTYYKIGEKKYLQTYPRLLVRFKKAGDE